MARERFRYDVFVSYSHQDAAWVRSWLVPALQRSRLKVCIDTQSFAPGAPILEEMERAVFQSRKTVLVLSPAYLTSEWAEFEQILAQTRDPAARARRVIPLLLAPCKLPMRLKMLNHVDFTRVPDREARVAALVQAIRSRDRRAASGARTSTLERRQFLEYVRRRYEHLDFKGMGISDRVPLQLRLIDMYVPLNARIELPEGETWSRDLKIAGRPIGKDAGAGGARLSEPRPVAELLREFDGVIILGDPGAGKTTFLKYVAVRIALGEGAELGLEGKLPVLLPLSAYAHALTVREVALQDFLADYYRGLGIDLPVGEIVDEALTSGTALLLMDGLDEVKDLAQRHLVVDRVLDFFAFNSSRGQSGPNRNKFVLTTRIVGYRQVRRAIEGIAECTLVDFSQHEIADFVQKWTTAVERAARGQSVFASQEAEHERVELLTAIERSPGVRGLAANPLLLTILALMKRQGVSLPDRRVELYQKYVETLLKHWNLARSLGRPPTRDLDVTETLKVLAPLALWMHETSPGVGLVKREEMRRRLAQIFAERGMPEPERLADQFLTDVHDHAGLLLERGPGQYGFIHLTFQEYLAAVGVALQGQLSVDRVISTLQSRLGEPTWREVNTLAIAHLGIVQQRDEAASAVVDKLLQSTSGEPGEAIALAGAAVADMAPGGVTSMTRSRTVDKLLTTMRDDEWTAPRLRVAAGNALGRLGDPRFDDDVWCLPVTDPSGRAEPLLGFVEVAGGAFWMGSNRGAATGHDGGLRRPPQDLQAYEDEAPPHEIELETFYISRYLVTLAQFRAFALEEKLQAIDRAIWGVPNHPAVLVSYDHAQAYCEWITEKLRNASGMPKLLATLLDGRGGRVYRVNLPTEAQWEKAARGTDGRLFPWGDEVDSNRANYEDSGVASVSPVGTFARGVSPYSVEDMSGNVWEWTRTLWGSNPSTPDYRYPYSPTDGREESSAGPEILRVVRGGSYDSARWNVRSAIRIGLLPTARTQGLGFRLALTPSLP